MPGFHAGNASMDAGIAPPIVVERSCTTLALPKWQDSHRSASFSSPHENRFAGSSRGPRWSCQRKPSRGPSRRCAAHLGGPCTVQKKNAFRPNLPVRASLGMRRLIANFPQSCHVLSECAATRLSTHAYAASCDVAFHSRVLVKAPCFSSRCRSRGWIPKEGAAAPSFWSFRKGVQGETQPKGFPPGLSLGATRFSRREKWVAYAQVR